MTEDSGTRHPPATPSASTSFGQAKYEIRNGQIIYADEGPIGVAVGSSSRLAPGQSPPLRDLSDALIAAFGTDYGVRSPISISRFTDMARQAAAYRQGRVLVAGDAAHIHPPDGGQGLQTGVQDAVNLGWKLAQVIKGISPESLLDTYHAERHPVGARVLRNAMASVALRREDDRTKALRETMAELLNMEEPRKTFAAEMSELGIRYDFGDGHPLLGRRMPDLDLTILKAARCGFLNFCTKPARCCSISASPARSMLGRGPIGCSWSLMAASLGCVGAAGAWGSTRPRSAVLVRPDGHVAWVGDGGEEGLAEALTRWFGTRSAV